VLSDAICRLVAPRQHAKRSVRALRVTAVPRVAKSRSQLAFLAAFFTRERSQVRNELGEDASGLSASSIQRLTEQWQAEHTAFRKRSLRFHRYCYLFVDGVHMSVRLGEDDRLCLLVVIGVREDGCKELLAVEDGYRESTDSWAAVFRDMRGRGVTTPKLVTGDGALGAWGALRDVFPEAREQRCWVHKTANALDALPKRLQPRAKALLHEMVEAPARADARAALEGFRQEFDAKYPKAARSSIRTGRS
jgi:putative transposase